MKLLCFILFFASTALSAQKKNSGFSQAIRPFAKITQGYYEQRLTGSEFSERERQPQDFICYPLWKTDSSLWFYIGWYSPLDKSRCLEESLLLFSPHNQDTAKLSFYNIPDAQNYSKEWAKKIPFEGLTPAIITNEEAAGQGFLPYKRHADGYYNWYSVAPLVRNTKGAPYNRIGVDLRFYDKKMTLHLRFYNEEQLVLEQKHNVFATKISSSYKKY